MVSRRGLLIATGTIASLAGCSDLAQGNTANDSKLNESDNERGEISPMPQDRLELGNVILQATDSETYDIQIAVEDETGVIHLDTYTINPDNSQIQVDRVWGENPSKYRLVIRVNDRKKQVIDVAEETATTNTCTDMLIIVDDESGVSAWNQACTVAE